MQEKVKVLYFVDRMLRGGIQSLVIDWVSRFDKEKIQVDFLLLDDGNKYELEDTLKKLGCNVYKLEGMWIRNPFDFIKYSKMLNEFFYKHHDYKVVHLHSTSKNYLVLKYAKKYGIKIRIAHSHNIDFQTKNPIKKIVGNVLKNYLIKYATDFFACSIDAGKWLFGKRIVSSNKFRVIHNAVNFDKFKYNEKIRNMIRKELNISEDSFVIGHIGRFTNQKNHEFLINVFYHICKNKDKSILLLIGTGEKENELRVKCKNLGIEKNVIFAGYKENANMYLSAMDTFVFPSKYEGLGLVLIEAQVNGLKCFTSKNVVPKEAKVSRQLEFLHLDKPINWSNYILNSSIKRNNVLEEIKESGYDIKDVVLKLEDYYLNKE